MRRYKPYVHQPGLPPLNPALVDKELVERMCAKSLRLFGVKWRWRKLAAKAYCTAEELEKRFDIILDERDKMIQQLKEKQENGQIDHNEQLGNDDRTEQRVDGETSSGTKASEGTVSGDKRRSKGNDNKGQEVRSGKANDESTTTRGTK